MATPLKHLFDAAVVRSIGEDIRAVHRRFDEPAFVRDAMKGLTKLELTARGSHVADVLRRHLPDSFDAAADVLVRSLRPEGAVTGMSVFRYMPHTVFVARYGLALEHFETSMRAQYELTKRFTAEFSIRPFLERHPEATYERLETWSRDRSVHVRRLVSEGTRPRLPWAPRLRAFQKDPRPVLRLLERLKDDPELYVRRSVANNLNDIGKDHPDLLVETCARWSKAERGKKSPSPERAWIVNHALRSLVKSGHRGALQVMGYAGVASLRVARAKIEPARPAIGGKLRFSAELVSTSDARQELLVDFAVHYVKADGATRPKVFKLDKLVLEPSGKATVGGSVSLAQMSTRTHYPGRHRIELLVNGRAHSLGEFTLVDG